MENFPEGAKEVVVEITFGTRRVGHTDCIREVVCDLNDDRYTELFPRLSEAVHTAVLDVLKDENVLQKSSYWSVYKIKMGEYERTVKRCYMLYPVGSYIEKEFRKLIRKADNAFPICYSTQKSWDKHCGKAPRVKQNVEIRCSFRSHGKKSLVETISKNIRIQGDLQESFEEMCKLLDRDNLS